VTLRPWVDPEVGWRKAARVLAPGGTLALIQYRGLREQHTVRDAEAFLATLTRIAPEIAAARVRAHRPATANSGH
jgi:hypothetical protein